MTNKIVILDFDGTLGDTCGLIVKTMQQVISELHLEPRTNEQCAAMIGLPLRETFTELIPMDDKTADACVDLYTIRFDENDTPGEVPLFPHVIETLRSLKEAGCTLTIASSRGRATLLRFLKNLDLEDVVTYVLSANDVEHAKPHGEPVEKTLAAHNMKAEDAIVVGDTVFDVKMAHNAGVRAIGVTYGNGTREEMVAENTEYIIDDFAEVLDIVVNRM